jgi:hypothetical protein
MQATPPCSNGSIFDSKNANANDRGTAQVTQTKSSSVGGNGSQCQYNHHGIDGGVEEYPSALSNESILDMLVQNINVRHGWMKIELGVSEGETSSSTSIAVRRNIVADVIDGQMYLSLGIKGCRYDKGLLEVDVCLLQMEEDELEENGGCFPLLLESEDESLQQFVDMEEISGKAAIVHIQGTTPKQVLKIWIIDFQKSVLHHGSAKFSMNEEELLLKAAKTKIRSIANNEAGYLKLVKYLFRHEKTGAKMELRSPLMPILNCRSTSVIPGNVSSTCNGGSSSQSSRGKGKGSAKAKAKPKSNKKASFALDSDTSDDDGMQDEYEEDGFIVFGDVDSSEDEECNPEKNEEVNDDNDVCEICMDGGELLVCDGGVYAGGCGLSFHAECVQREEIPDGKTCFLLEFH